MNDRRNGANFGPGSALSVLADLEAIDRKLSRALGGAGSSAEIEEAREFLRAAINALARIAPAESIEEASASKRRVKIKAESEVAAPDEAIGASKPAKAAASSARSAARGARSQDGARAARRMSPATEKAPNGSLIARLGAARADTSPPTEQRETAPAGEAGKPGNSNASLGKTAERLAQLEAEIADLAEALTVPPARATAREPGQTTVAAAPKAAPAAKGDEPEFGNDAEEAEEAEITIVGPDGVSTKPAANASRQSPRIFREGSPPFEEEAEVEIRGSGLTSAGTRITERPGTASISARAKAGVSKGGALGKWRIFRGS